VAILKHGGTLGPCFKAQLQLRRLCVQREKWYRADQDGVRPGARIQSGPSNAAKGGAQPPPTIMATASSLPRLLMAAAAPAMTWLLLNVAIVDNDRGDSPSSYIARARLGLVLQSYRRVPLGCMQGGSRCPGRTRDVLLSQSARGGMEWHDPVLGWWHGLTPVERPALCLRGLRASQGGPAPGGGPESAVSDPPGLGRR